MNFDIQKLMWIYKPQKFLVEKNKIEIQTEPKTDFWQRTYYGFQNDNAPALLMETKEQFFSFTVKADFCYKHRFDQCGLVIYQNSESWAKASIEYENTNFQKLGSVVTNYGYSDWATTDITSNIRTMYYRISRRKNDFCFENSLDGEKFNQLRIFHLFDASDNVRFGIYACSPEDSSFTAIFTKMDFTECKWDAHK